MKQNYLIDLDGTLLYANRHLFEAANIGLMLKRFVPVFGLRGIKIVFNSVMAMLDNDPSHGLNNFETLKAKLVEGSGIPYSDFRDELWSFYRRDFSKLKFMCQPVPNSYKALRSLKGLGVRLYLATNPIWPEEVVHLRLQWAGVPADLFDGITHSQNWSACKPKLIYYQELVRKWQLRPAECLMIGDSLKKDGPARALGIETVIIPPGKLAEFWDGVLSSSAAKTFKEVSSEGPSIH